VLENPNQNNAGIARFHGANTQKDHWHRAASATVHWSVESAAQQTLELLRPDGSWHGGAACPEFTAETEEEAWPTSALTSQTPKRRCARRSELFFPEPEALLSDAPVILGTDGQKMSKSRRNAIWLSATAEETARIIRAAKTDADRHITYDPVRRPEVSNLVLLTALCEHLTPEEIAEDIGDRGAAALKLRAADAINERLRPVRALRAQIIKDRAYLRDVLREGNAKADTVANDTLDTVRKLMHTAYP
jgi:tryptophanyl-tRNA synthetase